MQLYTINTGNFMLDGGAMFGVVPKTIWSKFCVPNENNLTNWAMRCLLIQEGNRLILVDTGLGDKQDAKFFGHYYLNGSETLDSSLAKHGFHRDDITDVSLTHLHFDHCGGCIIRKDDGQLIPAFKNATFWSNEVHWKTATIPNDREKASFFKENILPMQECGQLKFVPYNNGEIIDFMPGIKIRFAAGHTDAMMLPQISYKGKTIVYMADLLPSIGHIPIPYVMAYDMHPLTTLIEKKAFLQEALEKDYILYLEHDVNNECCTLKMTDRGIRHDRIFKLEDI